MVKKMLDYNIYTNKYTNLIGGIQICILCIKL